MATLADLLVKIGVDASGVDKGAKEMRQKLEKTWAGIEKAGALAGAAAGAALMGAMVSALDVDAATDKLIGQVGATGEQAARLGEAAGALYADGWGQSIDDVNAAIGAVVTSVDGMRNATAAQLQDVTEDVLAFSTAFEVDAARAVQVAGQAVKSGLVPDVESAMDLLTVTMQRVPAAVRDDILDAVDEYGPFMSQIGVQGERAFTMLVDAADKGMFGIDKTGDALKEFTIRATDMSTASQVAFDLLGMSQEQMTAKLLAGGETGAAAFQQIVDGLLAMDDPVKQSQAALALFGTPLEDLSTGEIPQFLETLSLTDLSLGDTADAADRLGETLTDNGKTSLEQFKRQVKGALVEQVEKAIPHLKTAANWLKEHKDLVVPLVGALGGFAVAVGTVSAAIKVWHGMQLLMTAATKAWLVLTKAVKVATVAWTAVQWLLNVAMSANPIGLIIIAIIALIAGILLLWHNSEGFRKFFIALWEGIKSAALAVGRWFRDVLWNKWIKGAWNSILDGGRAAMDWFKALPGRLKDMFMKVVAFISNPFRRAFNMVSEAWNNTIGRLSWTVPGWVPMIGGRSISAPKLPTLPMLAEGGIFRTRGAAIVGDAGPEIATFPAGAQVSPLPDAAGGPIVLELRSSGNRVDDMLLEILREAVRTRFGGNVQLAFTRRSG